MDFFEVLDTRRSIRSYTSRPVSEEDIATLLHAGLMAPSAMNGQPWDFIVVTERALLDAMAANLEYVKHAAQAQLAFVVCGDLEGKRPGFWQQDCAAAIENILLAARALNLASCWCGMYPVESRVAFLRGLLGIPERHVPMAIIVLGHTDKAFTKVDRTNPAKIHRNRW